jgi:protein-tyrosine phosphatase
MPQAADAQLPRPRDPSGPYRICCVCTGNICRSPMAEAVLRAQLAKSGLDHRVQVDSAGTGDWHVGDQMDRKARSALKRNGYNGESHRARQFRPSWLTERDLILAMDTANLRDLRALAPPGEADRIRLFGEIGGLHGVDVPDPYYGDQSDFATVLALLETGMSHLVALIKADPEISPEPATRPYPPGHSRPTNPNPIILNARGLLSTRHDSHLVETTPFP